VVDVHSAVRPPLAVLRARLRKPWVAALALRDLAVLERGAGRRR
jgi:hypothetical protein